MGPSVVLGPITVGELVDGAGRRPSWLPGPASCGGCQLAGGRAGSQCDWLWELRGPRAGAGPLGVGSGPRSFFFL